MRGNITIRDKSFKTLYSAVEIEGAIARMAGRINRELEGEEPVFLPVLNGSFMFASDLLRKVTIPCEISFIKLRSYDATTSTGKVKTMLGLDTDVKGRSVVIVEDIVDTGLTVESLTEQLQEKNVRTVKVATLLFKPASYKRSSPPDYFGFEVPDRFVVGYGMDYCGLGRNLAEVRVLA